MLKMIKLGGSLITDKRVEQSFRADVMSRIAREIATALPSLTESLIIGHVSGSFGHFAAKRHDTINGVQTAEQWRGFAEVGLVAAELNMLVAGQLWRAGVPIFHFQSSAALTSKDGIPHHMPLDNLRKALENDLIPLVYGDVGFDTVRGGKPDLLLMSRRTRRSLNVLARASGSFLEADRDEKGDAPQGRDRDRAGRRLAPSRSVAVKCSCSEM